jgi:hypothetical protein
MNRRFRAAGLVLASVVLILPVAAAAAPVELPTLPEHAAEKVAAAQAKAAEAAGEMKGEKARGLNPDKTTGLERAAEVSNSWRFTGEPKPGNGNGLALGQGRADLVHAALAAGISPSTLDKHGESVSAAARAMAKAFEGSKAKWDGHPGKGEGKGLGGPGGGEDDD